MNANGYIARRQEAAEKMLRRFINLVGDKNPELKPYIERIVQDWREELVDINEEYQTDD